MGEEKNEAKGNVPECSGKTGCTEKSGCIELSGCEEKIVSTEKSDWTEKCGDMNKSSTGTAHSLRFGCADCGSKACEDADYGKMPAESVCLTKQVESDWFKEQYNEEDLEIAHNAAVTEASGYCRWTRVEETMAFAWRMGYKKLGIGFCVGLSKEAATLAKILRENGFEVLSASCKCGSIPKSFVGVTREEQLHPEREAEIMCNPAGQAAWLSKEGCELLIILGLCVGHDTLFIRHAAAPVTVLSGKDRVLAHNPIGALYQADAYLKRVHTFIRDNFGDND